jgi:hypothetical protein
MQVSAAEGRLLVVATKSGATLGDPDQKELEDLINKVLEKAEGGSRTGSPMQSSARADSIAVACQGKWQRLLIGGPTPDLKHPLMKTSGVGELKGLVVSVGVVLVVVGGRRQ